MLELSAEQRGIVEANGHVVVIAGPGAGKTRTVVAKVEHLLNTEVIAYPFSVLAVTFTDAAARELRGRLSRYVPKARDSAWCGTFHGLGGYLLRAFGRHIGVAEDFVVADRTDTREIRDAVVAKYQMFTEKKLADQIEGLKRLQLYPGDASPVFDDRDVAGAYSEYQRVLRSENMLDFDDLAALSLRLLRENADVRALVRNKYRYVIVDEFQDSDSLQLELVTLLALGQLGSMVVADDDQAIFAWRGAVRANVQTIQERLGATVRPLVYNFRSKRAIVSAASAVINKDTERNSKTLTTDDEGGNVLVRGFASPAEEALAIVTSVERMVGAGLPPHEIAIISRSRYRNDDILAALKKMSVAWFDRDRLTHRDAWEVQAALSLTRLSLDNDDGTALGTLVDALDDGHLIEDGFLEACEMRHRIRPCGATGSVKDIQEVTVRSGLISLIERIGRTSEQRRVRRNLELLMKDLELEISSGIGVGDAVLRFCGEGALQFMTGHAAKGREFDTVFMMGLEDDVLPSYKSRLDPLQFAEERRIFYVALTRARLEVNLSYARSRVGKYGKTHETYPSRFIADLPSEIVGTW